MTRLYTVGHGTATTDELIDTLRSADIRALVDVRRFPGSRRHPHLSRDALSTSLPAVGIAYRWEPGLGGRRRLAKDQPTRDPWWQVEAFRAYAAYARTAEFSAAFEGLLLQARTAAVTVMCSETVWWRCHRRLIADVATLRAGVEVLHLMPSGPVLHRPAAGARLSGTGEVVWDDAGVVARHDVNDG